MTNSLFVGGFPYETTQEDLAALFRTCGKVANVKILMDRETGRSRGIGFVDMSTEAEARAAMAKLNGSTVGARTIFVSEARPQEKSPSKFAGKPGFVERRSGKDRRQAAGAPEGRREGSFERKKPWAGKPDFPKKDRWEKRPDFGAPKKPWDKKPGDKKKWDSAGPDFGAPKKSWGKKPGGKKKWGPAGPASAKKWGPPKRKKFGSF